MSRDPILGILLAIPLRHPIDEEDLANMVAAEAVRLSDGARVHDFIRVFAARRVRDKLLHEAAAEAPGDAGLH